MDAETLVLFGCGVVAAMAVANSVGARRARRELAAANDAAPREVNAVESVPAASDVGEAVTAAVVVAAPAKAKAMEPTAGVARLDYEEDGDIDPTKVGATGATSRHMRMEPHVQSIVYDDDADTEEPTAAASLFLVSATAQTDTGRRRKRNEDSLLVSASENLFVVADGMGGYKGGQLASQLAVKTIKESFSRAADMGSPRKDIPRDATALARAIQLANDTILETAGRMDLTGMGTTICAARFSPNKKRVYIGHVGDSRCYRLRGGTLKQITADHTMSDFGVTGPESGHLSRAVGIWPSVPIDIIMAEPLAGDIYLLCSDGLTKMIPDTTIAAVLQHDDEPQAVVDRLITFANAHGGKDNITVILVRVVSPDWKPARAERAHVPELTAAS